MAWLECQSGDGAVNKRFSLKKAVTSIGRTRGNDLVLDDPNLSTTHASILRTGSTYIISPGKPGAVVYVNQRKIRRAQLAAGDTIILGRWSLTYHKGAMPAAEVQPVSEGGLSFMSELYKLSEDLMGAHSVDTLFKVLLGGLIKLTKAEKGFIIVFKDGGKHVAAAHKVSDDSVDRLSISDSVVKEVEISRKSIIVSDALHDSQFSSAKSVVDLRLSSVMCVPLIYHEDLYGVIYLGNDRITDLFTAKNLMTLEIYAAQAALIVHNALVLDQLRLDNDALRAQLATNDDGREMVGSSHKMEEVNRIVERVAPTDLAVLLLGETGTGKELAARHVHASSARNTESFVAINCGAIPEALLESELFGHRKGAFTGADSDKIGKIEASSGGTLFLDEIGEMPMHLQVKLLRVLQEHTIERVGDVKPRAVDLRVVAATNRDPKKLIEEGKFREDLYYRLNEVVVTLPPLREREDDITLLAQFFLKKYKARYNSTISGFSNEALQAIKSAPWPGNVRQLESHIRKALILADGPLLQPKDLGVSKSSRARIVPLAEAQEAFKLDYIRQVLELNGGNKAKTARDLGVDARTIFRYVEKLSL